MLQNEIKNLFQKKGSFEATREEVSQKDGKLLSRIVMLDESVTKLRYEFLLVSRAKEVEQHFTIRLWEYHEEEGLWSDIHTDFFFGLQDTSRGQYLEGFAPKDGAWEWYVAKATLLA